MWEQGKQMTDNSGRGLDTAMCNFCTKCTCSQHGSYSVRILNPFQNNKSFLTLLYLPINNDPCPDETTGGYMLLTSGSSDSG